MTGERAVGRPSSTSRSLSKTDILDAALELLGEGGEKAVSFRAVAKRLGVTAMAVAHHVGSRADMLRCLVERAFSGVDGPADGETPTARLRFLLTRYCRVVLEHPDVVRCVFADPALFTQQLVALTDQIRTNIAELGDSDDRDVLLNVIVDYTHGFAISVSAADQEAVGDAAQKLDSYRLGLDWILSHGPARSG